MKTYIPINCGLYDYLEAFATQKESIWISYQENGQTHQIFDIIKDLTTQNHEEFLLLESGKLLRLDQIISLNDVSFEQNTSCSI